MENPATWGKAEQVVYEAWEQHEARKAQGFYAGLSLMREITDALRAEGLLKED